MCTQLTEYIPLCLINAASLLTATNKVFTCLSYIVDDIIIFTDFCSFYCKGSQVIGSRQGFNKKTLQLYFRLCIPCRVRYICPTLILYQIIDVYPFINFMNKEGMSIVLKLHA